jgi:hypothetical protein
MSYVDVGVHNLADSGAYGEIPNDIYLRKIQQTPYQEDPDQIEKHIRDLLIDFRQDDPWLASDLPRDPNDRGSGPHSTQFLNLRHFGVFGDESDPYLPDGTFTDHEFMERDPRGIATDPDMRKHMEQQYARSAFIKFTNDNDWSVPETGINPVNMVENIKSGMYPFKDRYKNFDESMDSWHNGGIGQSGRVYGITADNFTTDGTVKDLADAPQGNRRDAVSMLSDDPTIGFRQSVPDQRFKIAHYGFVRVNQDKNYQNWNNNRGGTFLDHANMAIINGELVNRSLARLIVDLQGQRNIREQVAQGAPFNDSAVNQQAKRKIDAADIYKIFQMGGLISQSASANESFEGKRVVKYGNKPMNDQRNLAEHVEINHVITSAMEQVVKNIKSKVREGFNDLRDKIEISNANDGIFVQSKNRRITEKMRSSNQTRNVDDARYIEDQKTTMNYSAIKPMVNRKAYETTEWEDFGAHSLNTQGRNGKRTGHGLKTTDNNDVDQDQGRLDFGVYDHADKASSREHMGRNLQYSVDNSEIENSEQVREIDDIRFKLN